MKTFLRSWVVLGFALCITLSSHGQNMSKPIPLGKSSTLFNDLYSATPNKGVASVRTLKAADNLLYKAVINYKEKTRLQEIVIGSIQGIPSSSFFMRQVNSKLDGHIILHKSKRAFSFYSDAKGNAFVKEVDIHSLICVDMENAPKGAIKVQSQVTPISQALTNLQSFPGAAGCLLLDFDGQAVSGTLWNNGNLINAAPSGMTDAAVQEHWEIVSEDYRPFNVNVTTSEAVFNTYAKNRRMRCIITPTNTAAPGAGGVAYIGSFNWNDDTPCWVFITSGKAGGEASSHELGHTFGLGHDGRTNPVEGYFAGHGSWAPIMGVGYYKPISQFSRGEYNFANNTEDDLAKISSSTYGVGYRGDDYGNSIGSANSLTYNATGGVNLKAGLIERTGDVDFFGFSTAGGNITLYVNTVSRHGDLDVIVRLYTSAGALIGTFNPAGLNSTVNASLSAGTYYISVDGTGAGNPATDGYSDYASIGSYWISGTIPPAVQPSNGIITFYKDCSFGGTAVSLSVGDFTRAQLISSGISDDDISSLKVPSGFKAILFWDDNFTGSTLTITGNDDCLVDNGWNDKVTSLRIRPNGVGGLNGTYTIQNRNSGLFMDVANNGDPADGTNILQWTGNGGTNQQFTLTDLGDGAYKIICVKTGKSVDINGASKDNFANVHQWTYLGGENQRFILVATDNGFYKLKPQHSAKLIEVGNASTAAGANINQYDDNGQTCGQWKLVPVTASTWSTKIEAENYSTMAGVATEACSEGTLNVGWIEAGDWMVYNTVSFPVSGTYTVEYRVASMSGSQVSLDLNGGAIQLGTATIPSTGGWQSWATVKQTVTITAGTYNVRVYATTGGWNINWLQFTQGIKSAIDENNITINPDQLSMYPNPAKEVLNFINLENNSSVKIYTTNGSLVLQKTLQANDNLSISQLDPGVYLILIIGENTSLRKLFYKE